MGVPLSHVGPTDAMPTLAPAGLLLPASTLTSSWFLVFALVVAFNTVIYLGLTLAKLVPWPAQIHPGRVRAVISRNAEEEFAMSAIPSMSAGAKGPTDRSGSVRRPDQSLRDQAALGSIPRAFALLGILVIVIALIVLVLDVEQGTILPIASLVFGVVLIGLAPVMSQPRINVQVAIWSWTAILTLFVIVMGWSAISGDSAIYLTYGVVAMALLPAVAMSWPASLVAGAVCLPAIIAAGAIVDVVSTPYWAVAATAGYVIGLISLQVRMVTLDRLTIEQERLNALASTDPLTGLLSRNGLLTLAPTIAAAVERTSDNLYVGLIEVVSMREINADYGLAYGDSVLIAVGRSVQSCLPDGDVPSRWSGDEFLVLGIGSAPSPSQFVAQVNEAIATSGVALGKRPVTVTASFAAGRPQDTTLEALIAEANARLAPG